MEAFFERESEKKGSAPAESTQLPPPGNQLQHSQEDDEVDPLDAFMNGVNETLLRENAEIEERQRREAAGEAERTDKERFFDDDDIAAESVEHLNAQRAISVCRGRAGR